MAVERKPLSSYLAPRYWPTWVGLGLLRCVCWLPHRTRLAIGRFIGRVAMSAAGSRRGIVRRNLELCFPDRDDDELNALAKRHFEALGMSLIEMGMGRWASDAEARRLTSIVGSEHIEAAQRTGRGVILLSAHFTTLEFSGRIFGATGFDFHGVYRRNRDDFITELLLNTRERSAVSMIEKRDIKRMVRLLRKGEAVWYAPDQSFKRKGAIVEPFFGVPAMQNTATSTLARLGDAVVVTFFPLRRDDGHYEIHFGPMFENFPSGDASADIRQYMQALETHIELCPEQYYWIHRRFKDLPEDYADVYADLADSK
ncbi:MAG: LpxL/LpxP family Kdo(2)-lipid IV(A) lauroyl/palmitoleoyl acyltransferase [Pseudomonadota bacterium]